MAKGRKIPLPKDKYISNFEVNDDHIHVVYKKRQKIALLFVGLNRQYWPYLCQIIKDARQNFLPQHHVDFHIWSDIDTYPAMREEIQKDFDAVVSTSPQEQQRLVELVIGLSTLFKGFPEVDSIIKELEKSGIFFKTDGKTQWVEAGTFPGEKDPSQRICSVLKATGTSLLQLFDAKLKFLKENATIYETDPVPWPSPTLMRYHLFLNQEEKLKEYDYVFYLDADMRMVQKVSDEILGEGLTAAPHPGYVLSKKFIPPYEPNPESEAYIHRLGYYTEEEGQKRFIPFYAAGGFQGGRTTIYLEAMKEMKQSIDTDYNNNYTAIWNDESHWNRYLWDFQKGGGKITFLDVSYIYPDSLIQEYYIPLWGKSYEPKIITLTKPFSLKSNSGLQELIQNHPKL